MLKYLRSSILDLKKVTEVEVEVREALPPAQFAQLVQAANGTDQNAVKCWDDGVYDGVVKIVAKVKKCNRELVSIQFTYIKCDGTKFACPKHGGDGGDPKEFDVAPNEHVIRVTAYKDKTNSYLERLIFYTDKDRHFDTEKGESRGGATEEKKIVGFQGKADANHLCDISVHKKAL